MIHTILAGRGLAIGTLALCTLLFLVACDQDNREDSPLQTDQDITAETAVGESEDGEGLETDTEATVEPTAVEAAPGETITVVGVLARDLSDRVITLEGVTIEAQPAEELIVIIPSHFNMDELELDEGSLVAVHGEVVQITREQLDTVDEAIFREHGELLEGFRAQLGILATDLNVADEDDQGQAGSDAGS